MRRECWLAVVVLVGLAAHARFSVWPALHQIDGDFANYYVPARAWREGRSLDRIYERPWFQAETLRAGVSRLGSFVPHPPLNALLLAPVARCSPETAKAIWTIVLAAAYLAAYVCLRRALALHPLLLATVFLLPTASLANALRYGQPYPLLLFFACAAMLALQRGRRFVAGVLLAPLVVLKLHGLVFIADAAWRRRWRLLVGIVVTSVALTALSLICLGPQVHRVFFREILPASLTGRIQDPYSPIWGSGSSLMRRLFEREPDLNPHPALDVPQLAEGLAHAWPVAWVMLTVLVAAATKEDRERYAILIVGALVAAPLTASYHFILLTLPAAVFLESLRSSGARVGLMALLAFATSSLPHHLGLFAVGWASVLAYSRLLACVALFFWMAGRAVTMTLAGVSIVAGGVVAAVVGIGMHPPVGEHLPNVSGYLVAEPVECEGGLVWTTVAGDRLAIRAAVRIRAVGWNPRAACVDGDLVIVPNEMDPTRFDRDAHGNAVVWVDENGALRVRDEVSERMLVRGQVRHPRFSPDGTWIVYQTWSRGSWNVEAITRAGGKTTRLADAPANEIEPSWSRDGSHVLFASDGGRGLGATTLLSVPFPPVRR